MAQRSTRDTGHKIWTQHESSSECIHASRGKTVSWHFVELNTYVISSVTRSWMELRCIRDLIADERRVVRSLARCFGGLHLCRPATGQFRYFPAQTL